MDVMHFHLSMARLMLRLLWMILLILPFLPEKRLMHLDEALLRSGAEETKESETTDKLLLT